jgi:hypothetical protein
MLLEATGYVRLGGGMHLLKPGNDMGLTHGCGMAVMKSVTQGRAKRTLPVTSKKCTEAQAKTASKHLGS